MSERSTEAALVEAVREALAGAGDGERAAAQQAYMKSALPFHGITSPQLRALLRPILADPALRLTSRERWAAAITELWDGATHREQRYAALAVARHRLYRGWVDEQMLPLWEHLVVTGAWWDLVDEIAGHLVADTRRRSPEAVTPVLRSWAVADDLWLRRTAILSQLGAREGTDLPLLTTAIEANLEGTAYGSQFFVRKAIGWALRDYGRTDPAWVRAFVAAHADQFSGLSRREALKHLG